MTFALVVFVRLLGYFTDTPRFEQNQNIFLPAIHGRDSDDLRQLSTSTNPFPPTYYKSFLNSDSVRNAIGATTTYDACNDAVQAGFSSTGEVVMSAALVRVSHYFLVWEDCLTTLGCVSQHPFPDSNMGLSVLLAPFFISTIFLQVGDADIKYIPFSLSTFKTKRETGQTGLGSMKLWFP